MSKSGISISLLGKVEQVVIRLLRAFSWGLIAGLMIQAVGLPFLVAASVGLFVYFSDLRGD